jgi:hypothetical protein
MISSTVGQPGNQVTPESRAFGATPFAEVERLAKECIRRKVIKNYPVGSIGAMLGGLAETTMGFIAASERGRTDYCRAGFETFWRGISTK